MDERTPPLASATRHPRARPTRTHSDGRSESVELSVELLARFLHALADPTRLRILELLACHGEQHVSALVGQLQQAQGRVSAHLSCLRTCGLVTVRRVGKYRYYAIADHRLPALLALARELAHPHAAGITTCLYADQH